MEITVKVFFSQKKKILPKQTNNKELKFFLQQTLLNFDTLKPDICVEFNVLLLTAYL